MPKEVARSQSSSQLANFLAEGARNPAPLPIDEQKYSGLETPASRGLPAGAEGSVDNELHELPGLPGSAGLFLSAALSIGAWHVLRSARHVHLSHAPDWYHSGGPAQVGHAVPFDLDFGNLLLCSFGGDVGAREPALRRFLSTSVALPHRQCALILAAPRGPPALF